MSQRFWIADTHFNHPNILKYCTRPQLKAGDLDEQGNWMSVEIAALRAEQMNTMLIRNANSRVKEDDRVICVGDFACKGGEKGVPGLHIPSAQILSSLNGRWTIVEGNHDDNNGVKADCEFMTVSIGRMKAAVRHRPLMDEGMKGKMHPKAYDKEMDTSEYCRRTVDVVICGHVHNSWHTKKIAGIWHVNVGVDVNRYMPITDSELINIIGKIGR